VHKLAQLVYGYVRKHDLLQPGNRVGIAVSGGADSVALLRLMLELRQEIGLVLSVVHINHKLRGAESDGDEAFVRDLAETHGLELHCENCDSKTYAAEHKLSVEATARELRYEFFGWTLGGSLDRIATAHTLDDQAETLLFKLVRGAGTRGLAGIWPKVAVSRQSSVIGKSSIQHSALSTQQEVSLVTEPQRIALWEREKFIVRPLLATRREDLRSYLDQLGQAWREDSSNRDLRHTRNRIRHGILPRFEKHVNPHVRERLAETSEIARGEEEYWSEEIGRLSVQVWQKPILDFSKLATFPIAVQRRLVRFAGESMGLALEFGHVEEILDLKTGSGASLPGGWGATRQGVAIKFYTSQAESSDYEYLLTVPGTVLVPEMQLTLETTLVNQNQGSDDLLEAGFAQRDLVVRNWRAGERFWPAHTKEPRKIKELLQDQHITGAEKTRWPVIASGDEIVWVRGLGVRRDFRAKGTGGVLILERPIT
jgi:tRNA(Ile)-lysidine synthase